MIKNFTLLVSSLVLFASTETASAGRGKWPRGIIADYAGKTIIRMTPPDLRKVRQVVHPVTTRNKGPNFDITRLEKTTIFNNYGHGEGSAMLAPGSAVHVADLIEKEGVDKKKPIAIYGSRIVGLFTAKELLSRKFSNITIYPVPHEEFMALTTVDSGYENSMVIPQFRKASAEMKKLVEDLWVSGFQYYSSEQAKKELLQTIRYMPYYCENHEDSGFKPFVERDIITAACVILAFPNGTMREAVCYPKGLYLNTREMTENLKKEFLEKKLFGDGRKPSEPIIIKCTSFGAANMDYEQKLYFRLQNQPDHAQFEEPYILFSHGTDGKTLSGLKAKRSIHRFPGLIGGTSIKHRKRKSNIELQDTKISDSEFESELLLNLAREFYGVREHD